jgi:hypothetical protein
VVPAALYRTGDPLHRVLRGYKDAPVAAARRHFAGRLAEHLSQFLGAHRRCIAAAAAGATWDSVAVVPSSTRTPHDPNRGAGSGVAPSAGHPLGTVVATMSGMSGLTRLDIGRGAGIARHLAPSPAAFAVGTEANSRRVLLLDDTWVTGARARSAAVALGRAGAEVVAIVVAGRAVGTFGTATVPGTEKWWRWAEAHDAPDTARCCLASCSAGAVGADP